MRPMRTILTGIVLTVAGSMALAEQALTGTVTVIDRINGTISIQQPQSGTVGANGGATIEQFKIQNSLSNTVHAGDKVTFTFNEAGGSKTITKIDVQ